MSLKNNLLENETILYQFSPHWIVFLRPFIWLTLSLIILLFGPFYSWSRFQIVQEISVYQCLASFVFILGLYSSIKIAIDFLSAYFILTDVRVIILKGFFRQARTSITLKKIKLIEVSQSLLGKVLCYGDFSIGKGSNKILFAPLAYPQWVQELLQNQIEIDRQKNEPRKKPVSSKSKPTNKMMALRPNKQSQQRKEQEDYAHE